MRRINYINWLVFMLLLLSTTACWQPKTTEPNNSETKTMDFPIKKTDQEWKKTLTPEQYYILREKGTESPFTGKLLMVKDKGVYRCSACGNVLFSSDAKFDSHCGWPSFDKEIAAGTIITKVDSSLGMVRTEIMCAKCGGHLGHVFNDGPTETGLRYCVNSVSLVFEPEKAETHTETITLGGGCFWCVEAIYQRLKGVTSVTSGYSGGKTVNPSYEDVCTGTTGHAESVEIVFNTDTISFEEILHVFLAVHDPTTLNRQGNDAGTQYRSVIFYQNAAQKATAEKVIAEYTKEKVFEKPIVTTLEPFKAFYKAEKYHQNYFNENGDQPYCRMIIMPKVEKFKKVFKEKLK